MDISCNLLQDSWEDALEDEKKDEEKVDVPVKAKKTAQQRIAEKEVSLVPIQWFIWFINFVIFVES